MYRCGDKALDLEPNDAELEKEYGMLMETATSVDSNTKKKPVIKDSCTKALVPRKDAPVVNKFVRGSLAQALASGAADRKAKTLEKLKMDEVAASGRGPRKSRWATWCRLHLTGCQGCQYFH